MVKNIALKYRLILGGVAAVFVPFFIAGIIIYLQLSTSLLEIAKAKSVDTAQDISALIDATLMQEIKLASAIAADPDTISATKTGDYQVVQMELGAIYKRIGRKFYTIFVADKNGIARADAFFTQQIGLDLSDRDYFLKAKQGEASVGGPLFTRGTATPGDTAIIVCVPIQENREFCGIVALAFNTDFIEGILSRKKVGRTGFAYLIDSKGLVLVHPKKEYMLKLRLLDQPGTEEVAKIIQGQKAGTASYLLDGSENIVGLSGMKLTGWIAAFTQSRDEIMSPVNKILSAIFVSGIIFLTITVLIIVVFYSKISHPIHKTMEMMKQVTRHSTELS